ncbi:TetR/AcrR family transcriptional regulator [Mesorhizobium sp. CAU 1741]|uniref:TetR/AcrR family transcriptional regulator n=1 Tax=Mesorhizobium sp. CAU 1741 TaxID=3140366 RepID=UPI00325AAD5E
MPGGQTTARSRSGRKGLSRARTDEEKKKVRDAFIESGRTLFATMKFEDVSLRKIAELAGYTPSTVYQYFRDQRSLLAAIREQDMSDALRQFQDIASRSSDPAERVRNLFMGAAEYWIDNFQHYQTLFEQPIEKPPVLTSEGVVFGKSTFASRSQKLYEDTVRDYLEAVGATSVAPKFAADCLIAVTHGMLAFPIHTRTMDWSPTSAMILETIDSLLEHWAMSAKK